MFVLHGGQAVAVVAEKQAIHRSAAVIVLLCGWLDPICSMVSFETNPDITSKSLI